jgi:glycosyltransferase involved in cell wall biosynthesis
MRVLCKLADLLEERGFNVTIAAFFESELPYFPVEKAKIIWINERGDTVESNKTQYNVNLSARRRAVALYRHIKANRNLYDIYIANQNLTAWPVFLARTKEKLCFYYIQAYEPGFRSIGFKSLLKSMFAYLTYWLPFVRIVNAEIYKEYKNIRAKYVLMPGLDFGVFYPKKHNLIDNLPIEDFYVGCVGREQSWKGSDDVGDAVKLLHEMGHHNIKLRVAFYPVTYDNSETVYPHGDKKLAEFYRSLDVLVAPGHIQLGAVHYPVIEAMASKVPVITTGYYPASEKNAYLVPIRNSVAIADAILSIYNDYETALLKTEIAFAQVQEFDWTLIGNKFAEIIGLEAK